MEKPSHSNIRIFFYNIVFTSTCSTYYLHIIFDLAIEIEGPVEIIRDQLAEKFSDYWSYWGLFFKVEAEITVNFLDNNEWLNVFHFTYGGDNHVNGYRIPALFINNDKYFYLCVAGFYKTQFNFELGQKYHIVFQQYQLEEKVISEVRIDGEIVGSEENDVAKSFPGMKLYISDPWWPAFTSNYGLLENFKITKYSKY